MFSSISIGQLLIILAIVIVIFGTKKLRSLGGDVGGAIKNFKEAMNQDKADDKAEGCAPQALEQPQANQAKDADFAENERDKR